MKTKLIYLIIGLWLCIACSKDDMPARDEFTDHNFIEFLHMKHKVPVTQDGKINLDDAMTQLRLQSIVELQINPNYPIYKPIYDVTGIRNLVNLDYLSIYCEFKDLDVSNLKYLTVLTCWGKSITHLNIHNTPSLESLGLVGVDQVTSLDLSGHPRLKMLNCPNCKLSTLDLKDLPELSYLDCSDNHLSTLDASGMKLNVMNSKLECGRQTDENGKAKALYLILSESQREAWEDMSSSPYNEKVIVTFKP